jgi:hypothetical protein
VPKISKKKNGKNGGELVKNGFRAFCGKNGKIGKNGGRRLVVVAERGWQWYGGGGFVMGGGDFGF